MTIVRDEEIRSGAPRIDGTRITVLDIKRRVVDNGEDAHVVAGEYEVDLADLYAALSYYYDNREALADDERAADEARRAGERRTEHLLDEHESVERAD